MALHVVAEATLSKADALRQNIVQIGIPFRNAVCRQPA
jgi:hypothetical protein